MERLETESLLLFRIESSFFLSGSSRNLEVKSIETREPQFSDRGRMRLAFQKALSLEFGRISRPTALLDAMRRGHVAFVGVLAVCRCGGTSHLRGLHRCIPLTEDERPLHL